MNELRTERVTFTGDTIIEVKENFISNTLSVFMLLNGIKTELEVTEIGDKFIDINTSGVLIPPNTTISITYKVVKNLSAYSEMERIKELEREMKDLKKVNKKLVEAVRNRVDLDTFRTYLKNLEKKLGVDLIDQTFSDRYP